ncbi:HD domain-containing protein [Mycobacterium aquaticum]|uniref:Phosphohydrolase n=1 Tax=Mycobacterium aquaticum TaxID=1927124 RepID=A0A1X0B1D7_9MYCO|nr:HD domain-containing protein [Mycobacterium aquaticum]ORA35666.1 phosphohydrolase [Mycobacterium aquaticum]
MTDDAPSAATWSFPDSEISTAALTLMLQISPEFIANHNQRSYVFARELAAAKGLRAGADYDDELVFLACILHDLGVTDYGKGTQRFEVDGADAAARFLRDHALPESDITTVWQSIALHTSLGLAHRFGADQAITHWGISVDVDGREKDFLADGFADRVHAAWPRHDLPYAMADLIAADIATTPSKGPPFTFPGHVAELLNGPVPSFFDVAAHNGWNDQPTAQTPQP